MITEAEALKKEIELSLNGRQIPIEISKKIISLIPQEVKISETPSVYISKVCTAGEYLSTLFLYDKTYKSQSHQFGSKEEMIYSYRDDTKAGILFEHRIRNKRGIFEKKSFSEIPKVNKNEFNIMLIKETTWDSNMYVGEKVTYTILIYDKDDVMEKLKASKNLEMLNRLKEEFKLEFSKEGESIGK